MPRMVPIAALAAETLAAAQPAVDWQGCAQTAAQIVVPLLVVAYVEFRSVPRLQRTLAAENAAREEQLQRRLAEENAARDEALQRRLDAENADMARRLHEEALAHSARVAAQQRYAHLLFEVRRDLDSVMETCASLRSSHPRDVWQALVSLAYRADRARTIASILRLDEVEEQLTILGEELGELLAEFDRLRVEGRFIPWWQAKEVTQETLERLKPIELAEKALHALRAVYAAVEAWVTPTDEP